MPDTTTMPSDDTPTAGPHAGRRAALLLVGFAAAVVFEPTRWLAFTIAGLLVLVLLHEAGHLFAARRVGLRAPEFSVGFGPALWQSRRTWRGTRFSVRAIPAGGYVKLAGMGDSAAGNTGHDADTPPEPGTWQALSWWHKTIVALAGPAANVAVTAACLFTLLATNGIVTSTNEIDPVDGGAADAAGLVAGDVVTAVDRTETPDGPALAAAIAAAGPDAVFTVERDGDVLAVPVTLDEHGRAGVLLGTQREALSPLQAVRMSSSATASLAAATVTQMGSLVSTVTDMPSQLWSDTPTQERALSPIGAAAVTRTTASEAGWVGVVAMFAVFSMFLAVFNLLPIPPLDGGHAAVVMFEAAASKVARRRVVVPATLLARMAAITFAFVVFTGLSALLLDIVRPIGW